jgi:hypothetical protein
MFTDNNTAKFVTIKGIWFDGAGYRRDLARPTCELMVDDGKIYDAELGYTCELECVDGDIVGWGDAYFSPFEGELARVEIGA